MNILFETYLGDFRQKFPDIDARLERFRSGAQDVDFDFLTETSSVYSSNIEGNTLDLNSYMNSRDAIQKSKDIQEIDALIVAYQWAQSHLLDEREFLHIHYLSSPTLLIESLRGSYRRDRVGVFGREGLIYLAIEAEQVAGKMRELFDDIGELLSRSLSPTEIFYYASLIHLVFVHIHPFADGNGRTARLLEKWFLTTTLGLDLWKIASEEYYLAHRSEYYHNIDLGVNYYELDYRLSLPFLSMLVESI